MRKAGVGRPTNQYNPKQKRKGATDYRQYARALGILDGSAIGDVADAVALIHATSKAKRSEFQKDIWEVRKERYGPSGRKDNPKKRKGATDYRQYARALGILDGSAIGDRAEAVALIHATSKAKRSEFQKDIWEVRKERYGPSGRKDGGAGGDSVPF